jgi:hypothetical protein|tara:strand:+ start:490 stop:678 length:189 start_codon:yes stop_codon:yes gene_type:complete
VSRDTVLRVATAALLILTVTILAWPRVQTWNDRRACAETSGRWIDELQSCARLIDAADQAAT